MSVALAGWPTTEAELDDVQRELATATPTPWTPPPWSALRAAGVFVCFPVGQVGAGARGDCAWAAVALVDRGRVVEEHVIEGTAGAPLVSGRLALREGPLFEAAVRALDAAPDCVLVDATGRDHPRRAGLALHLGARLDLPTVGVTRRTLLARGSDPGPARGDRAPLVLDAEVVGHWLRTRDGGRPLAVHAGWRVDAATAADVALALTRRARTPEPLRRARSAARRARAGARGGNGPMA